MALENSISQQDIENAITSITAAFDARFPAHCTEMQRGIAKGFYAALHAVALSFGVEWSEPTTAQP